MKTLLESVIRLSETLDALEQKNSSPAKFVAFHETRKVFLSLMEKELHDPSDLQVYHFNEDKESFELDVNG